jgi:hypothetical protein
MVICVGAWRVACAKRRNPRGSAIFAIGTLVQITFGHLKDSCPIELPVELPSLRRTWFVSADDHYHCDNESQWQDK